MPVTLIPHPSPAKEELLLWRRPLEDIPCPPLSCYRNHLLKRCSDPSLCRWWHLGGFDLAAGVPETSPLMSMSYSERLLWALASMKTMYQPMCSS